MDRNIKLSESHSNCAIHRCSEKQRPRENCCKSERFQVKRLIKSENKAKTEVIAKSEKYRQSAS